MNYNKLLDTNFKGLNWKFINCEHIDGYLLSNDKIFGITQELTLHELNKLYFRIKYKTDNYGIKQLSAGIHIGETLEGDIQKCAVKKWKTLSTIVLPNSNKIKVTIIFESEVKINKVYIKELLLVDLKAINKENWLKHFLDSTLYFKHGYYFKNMLYLSDLKLEDTETIVAKQGFVISTLEPLETIIDLNLTNNRIYLIKINYVEGNDVGKTFLKYGNKYSDNTDNQAFMVFRYKDSLKMTLNIIPNNIINYIVNIRNILLIDVTDLNLDAEDIPYLPYN